MNIISLLYYQNTNVESNNKYTIDISVTHDGGKQWVIG